MTDYLVYIGTYTRRDSEGLYVYRMDGETGALEYVSKVAGLEEPSFLTTDPQNRFLYVVSEIEEYEGKPTGTVSAYSISPETGELGFLNTRLTGGTIPCHVQVNRAGSALLLANYGSGSVASFPIGGDGALGEAASFFQHEGSSVNPERQEGPHAHSINLDASNRFAFVPDLGADRVMFYRFDADTGRLEPNDPAYVESEPGAGPRHFDFHPDGRRAYVINELGSTVTAYDYDAEAGTLSPIHTVSTLPEGYEGDTTCSDIHVTADGRFVYGSNRGHDSIARFSVDQGERQADAHGPHADPGPHAPKLRHRPQRTAPPGGQTRTATPSSPLPSTGTPATSSLRERWPRSPCPSASGSRPSRRSRARSRHAGRGRGWREPCGTSCMRTSTPSTPPSSNWTTRPCGASPSWWAAARRRGAWWPPPLTRCADSASARPCPCARPSSAAPRPSACRPGSTGTARSRGG